MAEKAGREAETESRWEVKNKRSSINITTVIWYDATSRSGWVKQKESSIEVTRICSSGHLVKRDKREIVLALGMAEDGDFLDEQHIPIGCVKKIIKKRIDL